MAQRKRILNDFKDLKSYHGIFAEFSKNDKNDDDIYKWIVTIVGPPGTPYDGGLFKMTIDFPSEFPIKPPVISFITKIFHPNISSSGKICMDILKDQWSITLKIGAVLLSIISLLDNPNPNDPLDVTAANLYLANKCLFDIKALEMTKKFAGMEV